MGKETARVKFYECTREDCGALSTVRGYSRARCERCGAVFSPGDYLPRFWSDRIPLPPAFKWLFPLFGLAVLVLTVVHLPWPNFYRYDSFYLAIGELNLVVFFPWSLDYIKRKICFVFLEDDSELSKSTFRAFQQKMRSWRVRLLEFALPLVIFALAYFYLFQVEHLKMGTFYATDLDGQLYTTQMGYLTWTKDFLYAVIRVYYALNAFSLALLNYYYVKYFLVVKKADTEPIRAMSLENRTILVVTTRQVFLNTFFPILMISAYNFVVVFLEFAFWGYYVYAVAILLSTVALLYFFAPYIPKYWNFWKIRKFLTFEHSISHLCVFKRGSGLPLAVENLNAAVKFPREVISEINRLHPIQYEKRAAGDHETIPFSVNMNPFYLVRVFLDDKTCLCLLASRKPRGENISNILGALDALGLDLEDVLRDPDLLDEFELSTRFCLSQGYAIGGGDPEKAVEDLLDGDDDEAIAELLGQYKYLKKLEGKNESGDGKDTTMGGREGG
ncbi:MAG: hypothetical protein ACTSU5_10640 [Promethearchaeota archaeon]